MKKLDMTEKLAIFRPLIKPDMMIRNYRYVALALLVASISFTSCDKGIIDPALDPNNKPGQEEVAKEYTIDQFGYATFQHEGFTFKLKASVVDTDDAKKAIEHMKADIDHIVSFCPDAALKVMKKKPIWMEENNKANTSAAWYHRNAEYPASIGDISAKGKCAEITNYNYYVSWSNQNQPLMVFHELCHLYHDQGLGGDTNSTIKNAYNNAKSKGLYKKAKYRYNTKDPQNKWVTFNDPAYCMNDAWEYFSEMSEAYWGDNDYYPFNYEQLKEHDPVAFAAMETIWGKRPDKN